MNTARRMKAVPKSNVCFGLNQTSTLSRAEKSLLK